MDGVELGLYRYEYQLEEQASSDFPVDAQSFVWQGCIEVLISFICPISFVLC